MKFSVVSALSLLVPPSPSLHALPPFCLSIFPRLLLPSKKLEALQIPQRCCHIPKPVAQIFNEAQGKRHLQ